MKLFWSKHKRIILIVCAIVFLVALFVTKNKTIFKKDNQALGVNDDLVYTNEAIGNLVDTDNDGVLDWEESLWGTDSTKKDTDDDGISDDLEIVKLKNETGAIEGIPSAGDSVNLTKTDQFSDELFATVAALTESGAELDETTIDKIGASLAENLQKSIPKKIYTIKDIKINTNESVVAIREYDAKLKVLQAKYPLDADIPSIVLESITDNGDMDVTVLNKFNPIINQLNNIVQEMLAIHTPKSFSVLHVIVTNGFQKLSENLADIKLVDTDSIVAFSAINQYEKNLAYLGEYLGQLISLISQRLNN
jgi:hypothetical protein